MKSHENILKKNNTFNQFGLKPNILRLLQEIKYNIPTDIQLKCIPYFLQNYDILGIAKTGSGKTASYILPILNKIISSINILQVLVLIPTRELAIQIANSFKEFSKYIPNIKILALYGGQKYFVQIQSLKKGVHIIIATPGRLLDHIKKNNVSINRIKILVLDEADEMLHIGFIKDVKLILSKITHKHQTVLFSATMPNFIHKISKNFMYKPKIINFLTPDETIPSTIQQYYCLIQHHSKIESLINFLETEVFTTVIIFVRTKNSTVIISSILQKKGYLSLSLNGDMNQNNREQTLNKLRNKTISILVATDLAARGLDILHINLIINYDIPTDLDTYIHRIGRTGRAGNIGKTILFIENHERFFLSLIKKKKYICIKQILIPDKHILLQNRILKLSNLINLQLDTKLNIFYTKLLNCIKEHIPLNETQITLSLLHLIYTKYYSHNVLLFTHRTNNLSNKYKRSSLRNNKYNFSKKSYFRKKFSLYKLY